MTLSNTPQTKLETFPDNVTLHLEQEGTGRAILILHGGAGPASVKAFANTMAQYGRVITPTHPGFGGTPRPEHFAAVEDLALTYLSLLERFELSEVLVIGFSIGGWIAAQMAVLDASRIDRVILVNAVVVQVEGETIADVFTLAPQELSALSFHDPAKFSIDPTRFTPEQKAQMAGNFRTLAIYGNAPEMSDVKLRSRLASVSTPTLVVWGASDRIAKPSYGRAFAAAFANAKFELIENCGHLPQIEQPDTLTRLVVDFALTHDTAAPGGPGLNCL